MTDFIFSNNAKTVLAQSISATTTVINVSTGDGSLFPSPASGQQFAVTLVDAATGLINEICYCTSRSGDQLTVVRGQEGTTAQTWSSGDTVAQYVTAGSLNSFLTLGTADSRYVSQGSSSGDYGTTAAGVRISDGSAWVRYTGTSGARRIYLQPLGNYALQSALDTTNTNLSTEASARNQGDVNLSAAINSTNNVINQSNSLQAGKSITTSSTGSTDTTLTFTPTVPGNLFAIATFMPSAELNSSGNLSTACTLSVSGFPPQASQTRTTQTLMTADYLLANTTYTINFNVTVNVATPNTNGQASLSYIFIPHTP